MFEEKVTNYEVKSLDELNQFVEQKKSEGYTDVIPYDYPREFKKGFFVSEPWPDINDPKNKEKIVSKEVFFVNCLSVIWAIYPTAKINPCQYVEDVEEIKKLLDSNWGKLQKADNPRQLRAGFAWYDHDKNEINSFEFHMKHVRKLKDILIRDNFWTYG